MKFPKPEDYGITGAVALDRRVNVPEIDPAMPPTQEELRRALDDLLFERVAKHRADAYNREIDEINYGASWR